MKLWSAFVLAGLVGVGAALAGCGPGEEGTSVAAITRGAAFTTFDRTLDGCRPGSQNGINCNHYVCQDRVYINGGPNRANGGNVLGDGTYYFAVLAPGSQNGGAAQGAVGNLSDNVALGGTDLGTGDTIADRTFTMSGGVLSYAGNHPVGTSPNGQRIVGVAPFDLTPNPGGVYILAICPVGSSAAADCKFDAFKTERCEEPPPPPPPPCKEECKSHEPGCVVCPPECDPLCKADCSDCTPCID